MNFVENSMLFSSMTFLWIFLPLLLIIYYLVPRRCKNTVLLVSSIIFYAWGEPKYILLILLSVSMNYLFGIWLDTVEKHKKAVLVFCLFMNLSILGYFKYFNFLASVCNKMAGSELLNIRDIALPLGISFYTFQALSYVIDVYRGRTKAQKNYLTLVLYIMLFPQLIAGPIVKYKDVETQFAARSITAEKTAYGIKRFIYGLSKKVILSNTLAVYADMIMDRNAGDLSTGAAWMGAVLYTLQIYFDFSGYSDMAIGLGKMLGFDFLENFNYPYMADSIQDFWRRWHISLSTWFRDYVYIPLGGNRKGMARTCLNILLVFTLTGFWHGAGFNFILWGVYYGIFLVLERLFLGELLKKNKLPFLNHLYTLLVVVTGWVLFRQESLTDAAGYLGRMFGFHAGTCQVADLIGTKLFLILLAGILLCGFLQKIWKKRGIAFWEKETVKTGEALFLGALLFLCVVLLVSGTYNPFIYFRF